MRCGLLRGCAIRAVGVSGANGVASGNVAGIFTVLEARWPLRRKQTEKEILKHPWRYVVTALGRLLWMLV